MSRTSMTEHQDSNITNITNITLTPNVTNTCACAVCWRWGQEPVVAAPRQTAAQGGGCGGLVACVHNFLRPPTRGKLTHPSWHNPFLLW